MTFPITFRWPSSLRRAGALLQVLGGFALIPAIHGQVVLNEILAENRTAIANGADFPDFIEVVNGSSAAVSLAGASLTDDPLNPRRFVFPAGLTIPAGGYLIVWGDDQTGSPGLHAGFALGAKGERVLLYAADGVTLLDEIAFGLQLADLSIGRSPDHSGAWVLTSPTPGASNQPHPTGSVAQVRLNEWMARPATGHDWIELFNGANAPAALGGLILTDSTSLPPQNRPIPPLSFIASRGFVQLFASDLAQADADHLDFRLGASGETLTLFGTDGSTVVDQLSFAEQADDASQGRAPDGSDFIETFPVGGATPGKANVAEITAVVISEVLSHTDPPWEDAIELQNVGDTAVDISHWWLSDSAAQPQKYRIPPGRTIPPSGFAVFYEYQFGGGPTGFSLDSAEGDKVFLSAGDAEGRLLGRQTFVEFGPLRNGISVGRYQTSVGVDFVPLSKLTFGVDTPASVEQFRLGLGQTNSGPLVGPVVISEIFWHPAGEVGMASQQFIELHNPTAEVVPLYDVEFPTNRWRLSDGVTFEFPVLTTLPPSGYLLVASFDPGQDPAALAAFRARWAVPASVPILGPFQGRLSSSGEALELLRPDKPEGLDDPNAGLVPYELVERIEYSAAAPWPPLGNASGHSLQRRASASYGNDPLNWIVGAVTPGQDPARDSDGDGLPDDWERAHGLSPDSALDAAADADGDGHTNREEYLAGTDPQSAQSVFRITSILHQAGQLRVVFPVVEGKEYHLQAKATGPSGSWLSVTNSMAAPATGEMEFTVPTQPQPGTWYRLLIPANP